jgi:uncharacterized phage protein (TIGR01671 family)
MREILFRGKTEDGEWVYGSHLPYAVLIFGQPMRLIPELHAHTNIKHTIISSDDDYGKCELYWVIPETVGQYAGFCDDKGNKIFEGDIIRACKIHFDADDEEVIGPIGYDSGSFFVTSYPDGTKEEFFELCELCQIDIVGNVSDSPEPLSFFRKNK